MGVRRGSRPSLVDVHHKDATSYVSASVERLTSGTWAWLHVRAWLLGKMENVCPGSSRWILPAGGAALVAVMVLFCVLIDLLALYSKLCAVIVPFVALMCGYLLLALRFRTTWTSTGIYVTFCGSLLSEAVGFFLFSTLTYRRQVTLYIMLTRALVANPIG